MTTIVSVRRGNNVVMGGDGQVSLGNTIVKSTARKVRRLWKGQVLAGFAGATALDQANLALGIFGVVLMIRRSLWAFPVGLVAVAVQGVPLLAKFRSDRLEHLEDVGKFLTLFGSGCRCAELVAFLLQLGQHGRQPLGLVEYPGGGLTAGGFDDFRYAVADELSFGIHLGPSSHGWVQKVGVSSSGATQGDLTPPAVASPCARRSVSARSAGDAPVWAMSVGRSGCWLAMRNSLRR